MPPVKQTYQKPKAPLKALGRVAGYLLRRKGLFAIVVVCVLVSALASVAGTYLLKPLLNNYIVPLVGQGVDGINWAPFGRMLLAMAGIYLAGVLATFGYSRLMIVIANGTLNAIRRDLFNRLEDLPIPFFDTHTHGEIMSRFTSDVDTLRDAISNGVT